MSLKVQYPVSKNGADHRFIHSHVFIVTTSGTGFSLSLQENTGSILIKGVTETPSKSTVTSQRTDKPVWTQTRGLRWSVSVGSDHMSRAPRPHVVLCLCVQVKSAAWNKEKPGSWFSQFRKGKQVFKSTNQSSPSLVFELSSTFHIRNDNHVTEEPVRSNESIHVHGCM